MDNVLELQSDFTVEVSRLPPYHMDFVEDTFPLEDFPVIRYKNVAGDTFDLEYKPPDVQPDPADRDDYLLYRRYHEVISNNQKIMMKRIRARRDFVLSNCVHVLDGPYDYQEDEWVMELEGGLHEHGYKVPTHPGDRYLAFIKAKVVTSLEDWVLIRDRSTFAEVTYEGVMQAMTGLGLGWEGGSLEEAVSSRGDSPLTYNVRLWESEVAEAVGLRFDEQWYSIPVPTREYMVASHIGRKWAANLMEAHAVAKANKAARRK